MTPRQARSQRRAAERKAARFARRNSDHPSPGTPQIPSSAPIAQHPPADTPRPFRFGVEHEEEFSREFLDHAASVYERHARKMGIDHHTGHRIVSADPHPRPANTANGSTGPRTPAGKLASSRNSLKHGLASAQLIMPGEDPAAFEALWSDLMAEHQPANPTEELLVHEIAQSWWLTNRALRLQNECFTADGVDEKRLALFLRYQTTHQRTFHKALNTLIQLRKNRHRAVPPPKLEFVSQSRPQAKREPEFVSQNAALGPPCPEFVRQNQLPENSFEGNAV